ncbi:hypothetical protein ACFX13_024382 [Malus domestica]
MGALRAASGENEPSSPTLGKLAMNRKVLYPILSPKSLSPARPRPGQPRSIKQLDRKSPQKSFKILSNYSLGRPPQINKWNDFSIPGAGAFGAMPVENTPLMNQLERFEW